MGVVNGQRLVDKVIVVIGGTSGLGLSAAAACVAHGACVVVVGRNPEKCRAAREKLGDRCSTVVGDAGQSATADEAINTAVRTFGGFNGLYHVAGGSGRSRGDGPVHEITDEGWRFTLNLNLDSLLYSNRAATQQLLRLQHGGSILNMSSVLAYSPSPRFFATHAYAATKAAAIGMTKASAAYYAKYDIRFNAVAPALVDTPLASRAMSNQEILEYVSTKQPLDGGRVGVPKDLDDAVVFLLSDESRFITGQVLAVDGGWSVVEGQYRTSVDAPPRIPPEATAS
ncbi:MAG: SDR family oxidoreductase [Planctomycetaceae bacterium]|nr:SDR family oxidoreductase [Planctomycetales bacterium]MCB9872759.1 SDR family oxidoreductase [Planctomycetaceae bacterium]MCB9926245.1 SDR family oxidoreductase [Planctomycetaceae bacterium]